MKSLREIEDELIAAGFPIARHDDPPRPVGPPCRNCGRDVIAHMGKLPRDCPGWCPRGR